MDMGSSSSGSGTSMPSMVFTDSHKTPLFSADWIPTSGGAYAGTCIFLVALAIISRLIQAYSQTLELRWRDKAAKRRYIVVAGETEAEREKQLGFRSPEKSDEAILTVRGVDERVRVLSSPRRKVQTQPWRLSTDLPRACIFTILSGVKYLLMLAVMTLNVGYFLSVLAGLFIGQLAIGRYAVHEDEHH